MQASQISFLAFAASRAAAVCPPAGVVQTANESSVVTHKVSGQRVGTLTHAERRDDRYTACISALVDARRADLDRWVLVQHTVNGPIAIRYLVRPSGRCRSFPSLVESLHRVGV